MPLIPTGDLVSDAARRGGGVGAFNIIQLEHLEAIISGAEAADAPVIVQISENAVRYHGALEPLGLAALAAARSARVPVAVHLDHAESADLVHQAVSLGFGSVMFDAATLPYERNTTATRTVADFCHERGVWVEAELGAIGGKDGAHAPGVRTDPTEARAFAEVTGADALAVAVGSSHAMLDRTAALDFDLIARLREAVPVPLVLHGSSGVDDAGLAKAIASGMTKVNIATQLNKVFTAQVRAYLDEHGEAVDPRKYLDPGRDAIAAEVERLLRILTAAPDGKILINS